MMNRTKLVWIALALVTVGGASCGGDDDGGGADAAAGVDGSPGVDGAAGLDGTAASCTCAPGQGCLTLVVGRTASDADKPWVLWPKEVDGVGTLIASASSEVTTLQMRSVADADYTDAGASQTIALGCLPAGTVIARVYLDDNGNAAPEETFSSDYRDTCLLDRAPEATIAAGETTTLELAFERSCD